MHECVTVKFPKRDIKESDRLEMMEFPGLSLEVLSDNTFKVSTVSSEKIFSLIVLDKQPRKVLRDVVSFWQESTRKPKANMIPTK